MPMSHCSPKHQAVYERTGTCFTKAALVEIAKAYNKDHRGDSGFTPIPLTTSKSELWKTLQQRFHELCAEAGDSEACWADITKAGKHALRPTKPSKWEHDPYTWLSNYDIMYVMKQYESKYRDFEFLGVFPVDFAEETYLGRCVSEQICRLDAKKLAKKGVKHFGAIFNLDRHDQSGSHWVALYVSMAPSKPNYGVYFYDSNSTPPPKEIAALMKTIQAQMAAQMVGSGEQRRFDYKVNKTRHQFKNSECGMFSMNFIIRCLEGEAFSKIVSARTRDENVHKLRDVYFRPPPSPIRKM
jgi:hypothetical protein